MVDGVTSLFGLHVQKSVVEVHNHEAEPAVTLLQLTVERNVKEMRRNLRVVTLILVEVQLRKLNT